MDKAASGVNLDSGRIAEQGYHHALRVNFILIIRKTLGKQAAVRLRNEFNELGAADVQMKAAEAC